MISGDIRRFFVEEENTYEGDVQILITVTKNGRELLTTMGGGSSKRFGRSYKDENYYETLSDSLIELVHQFAASEEFREALGG